MDKEYILAMTIIKKLLDSKMIKKEEYDEINKELIEKYKPILTVLF